MHGSLEWPSDCPLEPSAQSASEAWDRLSRALQELKRSGVVAAASKVSRPTEAAMLRSAGQGGVAVEVWFANRTLDALLQLTHEVDAEVIVRLTEGLER